jgi:hypothetical protein
MKPYAIRPRLGVAWLAVLAALVLALVWTVPAFADYEQQPEHFGVSGEAEQLENARAMAVNASGAGGVVAGSLYVVGYNDRVVRFAPGKEGEEPRFEETWGWGVGSSSEGAPSEGFQRCGPALTTEPAQHTYHSCRPANPNAPFGGEEAGHFETLAAVAVDQATGDVYVRNWNEPKPSAHRQHHLIEVLTAKGELVGEGFGDSGNGSSAPPESIAEGPEKLHRTSFAESGIAVDEAGTVYLTDLDYSGVESPQARVMSFEPESPGDYEHYVYAGQGKDIVFTSGYEATRIALVGAGRLVTANAELVREYKIGAGNPLTCSLPVPGQLYAITANPVTGEVFYYTFSDRSIHRLKPCDEVTGKFEEIQKIKPSPATQGMHALAVNPTPSWGPLRPAGVLYAADGEAHTKPSVQHGIGDIFAPAEVLAPVVEAESVVNATTTSATLEAKINPRNFETTYHFEYLSEAEYMANGESFAGPHQPERAPIADGEIAGAAAATVAAGVSGLAPDTAYRFRVVASSRCEGEGKPSCTSDGIAASFATYPSAFAGLPDGRAYELVSPPEKHGGEVFPADPLVSSCEEECKPPGGSSVAVYPMQVAPGGDGVAYMGYPFSPSEGSAVYNSYLSRRTSSGWKTTALSPKLLATKGGKDLSFSAGLSEGAIYQGVSPALAPGAPAGYPNLYLQSTADPGTLSPLLTAPPPHRAEGSLVLEYAGASPDYSCQLFAANDALSAATPYAPAPSDPGSVGRDLYEWCGGMVRLVNVLPGNTTVATGAAFASASPDAHAVSGNGRRVYWHVGSTLYVRENGQITREITHPGTFLTASENGLEVLLSDGCLYSLLTESCTDLTQGKGGFQGIAGQSKDLSRIYFVDTAALTGAAQPGEDNLYLYQQGTGTHFITTLAASDDSGNGVLDWAAAPSVRTAEASPDGRFLAFGSTLRLTGYDNVGPCGIESGVKVDLPCNEDEVFLFDSATGHLSCPSCNPTGEAPLGLSTLRRISSEPAWQSQPRYLTDSGRLYFDSQDRLSPRDTNGTVEDVYEAEPDGVGSCVGAAGCVSLISPGAGAVDSNFLAMDENGANVFFTTRERLVPSDTDELVDLYDAREGGGFAGESESSASECRGEACQPSLGVPGEPSPSSPLFQGAGNLSPSVLSQPVGKPKVQARVLTRAQKLTKALKECRVKKVKKKRSLCETNARKQYGTNTKRGKAAEVGTAGSIGMSVVGNRQGVK